MEHGIIDIALSIIAAWVLGVICQVGRQPLLLAYMAAGFLIGPRGFKWISSPDSTQAIAHLGLILLLFMIGLEIDLKKMMSAGKVILITAICQITGGIALGWLFFRWTGMSSDWLEGLYLAVAVAMSSTVIIVKLLHDKRELETLAGRITLGILIVQDLVVIIFLAIQPNLHNPDAANVALAGGKVLLLVGVSYLVSRFLLPPIFKSVARQPEMVLVGALAWCFAMASYASVLGLSREMGALIAGVMVSTFPYTLDVVAKVTSLRDFFVTLFFVGLGMTIPVPTWDLLGLMLVMSMFLVISRLITVFTPLHWMRLGHRVSLVPAINLCQMSELSLVLLTLGLAGGDVTSRSVSIAAFAFAFLAVDSTYTILRNDQILRRTSPWLTRFGLRDFEAGTPAIADGHRTPSVFLLGFSWVASSLLEEISRNRSALLEQIRVVDFNPEIYERLRRRGVQVVYGDISQRETLLHAGITHAKIVVCSLPDTVLKGSNNLRLLRQVRELNPEAQIIVHATRLSDVQELYEANASYVATPRLLEATHLLEVLEAAEKGMLDQKRSQQQEQLQQRAEVIP